VIPALYQLTTVVGLVVLARARRFGVFRTTQLLAFLVLPALLQVSLGGSGSGGRHRPTQIHLRLWGDTLNTASGMESQGIPGHIHFTDRVAAALGPGFVLRPRGTSNVKGKGPMTTFLLDGADWLTPLMPRRKSLFYA
jgi:hypothetical protein